MENDFMAKPYFSSDNRTGKALRIIGMVFVGLVFAVLFALVFGFLVKWIWNLLMPGLFGLSAISYWQAFGLVILAKLLFGAFGSHHHDRWHKHPRPFHDWRHRRKNSEDDEPWRRRSRDSKYYKQYWQDEGKAAFEAYMKRAEMEKKTEGDSGTSE